MNENVDHEGNGGGGGGGGGGKTRNVCLRASSTIQQNYPVISLL